MFGANYTGGYQPKQMPQIEVKEKFAWRPVLTTSGKWVWWRKYIKRMKIYWGPAGENPAIDAEYFTEGEWLLEEIKHPIQPPPKFKSTLR